jgi:hypothetical protein
MPVGMRLRGKKRDFTASINTITSILAFRAPSEALDRDRHHCGHREGDDRPAHPRIPELDDVLGNLRGRCGAPMRASGHKWTFYDV